MAVLVLGFLRLSAEDTLLSAVEGSEHAAVTTASGVFIAPRTGGPWRPIPLPPSMPSPGIVSGNPDPGGALYYHSVRAYRPGLRQGDPAQPLPTHPDWQYGLYRRTPGMPQQFEAELLADAARLASTASVGRGPATRSSTMGKS